MVDNNSHESTVGPEQKVRITEASDITINWKRIEHSSGYKVYRRHNGTKGLIASVTSSTTTYYTDTGDTEGVIPPTENNTRVEPIYSSTCTLNYKYGEITYDKAVEYASYTQVKDDHDIGSELTNIARLVLEPSFNNAPLMTTIVPKDNTYNAYLDCLTTLETADIQLVVMLYAGTNGIGSSDLNSLIDNWKPVYDHCASLSDPVNGQKERYAIFSLPYADGRIRDDYKTFVDSFTGTATKGKRGILVCPDGLQVQVSSWLGVDGLATTNYTHTDPEGKDITPLIYGLCAVARYAGLRDLAEPGTEKDIIGFNLPRNQFTDTEIKDLREYGIMATENCNRTYIISRFVNMSLAMLSIEDGELSIAFPEDYMRMDLRRRLRKFRGKKMVGPVLRAAKRVIENALDWYVSSSLIASYDSGSVSVEQHETEKTILKGFFKYTPIYPINYVIVEYDFVA